MSELHKKEDLANMAGSVAVKGETDVCEKNAE